MKILLNKQKNKKSTNVNTSLPITLEGRKRVLPVDDVVATLSEVEQYHKERRESNIVRLTCTINPLCTNVLHNTMTEIVKDEGSSAVTMLNYDGLASSAYTNLPYEKRTDYFSSSESANAIRDTQVSSESVGYKYHCGSDIFNNHTLRSITFKAISRDAANAKNDYFNTIEDYLRTSDGVIKNGYSDKGVASNNPDIRLHVYLNEEILSYKECLEQKLIEEKGWFGFTNVGKFPTFDSDLTQLDISKVINNRKPCDFIDMYPERDLFYFTPKYNKFRKREERNWLYCLTYPSSSMTENIDFIRDGTNSLRAIYFDDYSSNMNGTSGLKIYSVSKHGLKKGDIVNVYISDELRLRNAEVIDIIDDYVFNVFNDGVHLSQQWYEITKEDITSGNVNAERTIFTSGDTSYYIINHKKVNLDLSTKDISYKRVIQGEEVEYYVRVFSRLPNWRFVDREPSQWEMYKKDSDLISKYQKHEFDFESHIGKMAFAKNIYGDDISQIVFTDDIDIHGLKDNLGRPLTDIYLTIIKNNKGYREWYGIGGDDINCGSEKVEFSHAFGKLNCAFRLSKESLVDKSYENSMYISNLHSRLGLDMALLNPNRGNISRQYDEILLEPITDNDINYDGDVNFYGDLCCFSPSLMREEVIQVVENRFNTAQRELIDSDTSNSYFNVLEYDEIISDDYDANGFEVKTEIINNSHRKGEGYVYMPHYQIPIHTVSATLEKQKPQMLTVSSIILDKDNVYTFKTMEKHFAEVNDIIYLRQMLTNDYRYLRCQVTEILDYRRFKCAVCDEKNNSIILKDLTNSKYKFIKIDDEFPSYARLSKDGSCHFIWRDIIPNGYDNNTEVENYPFLNGAFYVNKNINFFLQRQDPKGETTFSTEGNYPYDTESKAIFEEETNNFYNEEDISCF